MTVVDVKLQKTEAVPETAFPLSYGQRALWFLERLAPGDPAYVIAGGTWVRGPVDPGALERAALALAARHPGLRTTFADGPAGPEQRVGEKPRVEFLRRDGRGLAETEVLALLSELAFAPFDFERGPLWRVVLVRLAGGGHAMALAVHHIVSDFWSLAILVRELGELYGRELELPGGPLPAPAVSFARVVEREAAALAGPAGDDLWAYWREALSGVPLVLDLPTDRPRARTGTPRGDWRPLRLPAATVDRLRRRSRRHGATLYMALLAGFEALLYRYTGQERLIVGCPTTGRTSPELAGLVAYLVNPVPIVADLRGDPHVSTLLDRARVAATAAFAHQAYPFALLAERLEPEREPGRAPVIQAILVLQKGRRTGEREIAALAAGEAGVRLPLGPLELVSLALPDPGAQLDLTAMLAESGGGLVGRLQYDRGLFEAATIDRLGGHFAVLLAALSEMPEEAGEAGLRLSALPLLSAAERHQLSAEWAGAPGTAVPEGSLARRLADSLAQVAPGAPAVIAGDSVLTYGELQGRAGRAARRLRDLGVGPGVRVGICLDRSTELPVGLLAVLGAGGTYVPLDPSLPAERLSFLLADSGVSVLLTRSDLAGRLPAAGTPTLLLDREAELSGEPAEPMASLAAQPETIGPEDLLYVIYTSGSTGLPKGAGIYPRGFLHLLSWYAEEFGITGEDRFLVLTSAGFDLTQKNFFAPLLAGGLLVLADPGLYEPREIVAAIERHGITRLNCTPSAFYPLIEEAGAGALSSLRSVFLGGEPIAPARLDAWRRDGGRGAEVVNTYGPTECTDVVAFHRLPAPENAEVSLGRVGPSP